MKRTAVIAFVIIHVVTAALTSCAVPDPYPNIGVSSPDVQAESTEGEAEQAGRTDGGDYRDSQNELIEILDAKTSDSIPSEAEAIELLERRGFADCTVTYPFDLDGKYCEDAEITEGNHEKRPIYIAYYRTEKNRLWTIHIINGEVFACPVSYKLDSDANVEVIVSETETITSYDCEDNKFYVTIPRNSQVKIVRVDRIDAETLESLTY